MKNYIFLFAALLITSAPSFAKVASKKLDAKAAAPLLMSAQEGEKLSDKTAEPSDTKDPQINNSNKRAIKRVRHERLEPQKAGNETGMEFKSR